MNEIEKMTKAEIIKFVAASARTKGMHIGVSDTRYVTQGYPAAINDVFVYFEEGFEVDSTNALGTPPTVEKLAPGGKVIFLDAVTTVEFIPKPKK